MAAMEKEPITKLEKWLNRIVTVALGIWQLIQYFISHPVS